MTEAASLQPHDHQTEDRTRSCLSMRILFFSFITCVGVFLLYNRYHISFYDLLESNLTPIQNSSNARLPDERDNEIQSPKFGKKGIQPGEVVRNNSSFIWVYEKYIAFYLPLF